MKSFIKVFLVGTILSIFIISLNGCQKNKSTMNSKDNKPRVKLSYATWVAGPINDNSLVEKKPEETFPDIDFQLLAFERSTWQNQINTRIAGGEIPDIFYRDHQYYVIDYVKQNILAEVPYTMIKNDAPDVYKASLEYGKEVWLACNVSGKNYGIPIMQPNQSRAVTDAWREDWLNKVGINKIPETLDEYEEALRRFVNDDPDGNGKNDTFGLTYPGRSSTDYIFRTIFSAYGVLTPGWMELEDGNFKYAYTMPQAKEAIKTLNRWYKEGLIDPEFVTCDTAAIKQKWANGKIGLMPGTWYRFIPGGEYYEALKSVDSNAVITMGPAPKGPEGKYGYGGGYDVAITSSICFSKELEKEPARLKRAVQVVNKMMADKELYGYIKYGKEAEHWKRDERNGVVPIPPFNNAQNIGDLGTNIFASFNALPDIQTFYARTDEQDLYKYAISGNVKGAPGWVAYFMPLDTKQKGETAQKVVTKWIINFIVGQEPVVKFDQLVQEWEKAGGETLTKAFNEAKEKGNIELDKILSALSQ